MDLGGFSLTGPREANEDNYYTYEFDASSVFVNGIAAFVMVSDGMGGYQGGDVASALAVEAAKSYFEHLADMADGNMIEFDANVALGEIVQNAHEAILAVSQECGSGSMGATFVGAFINSDHAWIGHVGDSRAYLVRDGQAIQLTEDHSQVGRMLSRGLITEEEAQDHPARNRIERALGFPNIAVDIDEIDLKKGDALLLCSDGVYTVLDVDALGSCVNGKQNAQSAAEKTVKQAIKKGSDDNSTAVIAICNEGNPTESKVQKRPYNAQQTQRMQAHNPRNTVLSRDIAGNSHSGRSSARHARNHTPTRNGKASNEIRTVRPLGLGSQRAISRSRRNSRNGQQGVASRNRIIILALAFVILAVIIVLFIVNPFGQDVSYSNSDDQENATTQTIKAQEQSNTVQNQSPSQQKEGDSLSLFVIQSPTVLKYVDSDGEAQLFDYEPLNIQEKPSLVGQTVLSASDSTNNFNRSREYRALNDSYLTELREDRTDFKAGKTIYDSDLSKMIGAEQYKKFLAEIAKIDKSQFDGCVTKLIIDADCLERSN